MPEAEIFRWPPDNRPRDEEGRIGTLHAKCAVADESLAFVSSANLTGDALESNMELGMLVEGGDTARRIRSHFDRLIQQGVLRI